MTDSTQTLAHKERTLQDVFDEMTTEEKDLQAILVAAALDDEDVSGDDAIDKAYDALSVEKKNLISFLVGGLLAKEELNHTDISPVGTFLEHFGVKGMKWGVVGSSSSGGGVPLSKQASTNPGAAARAKVKAGTATLGEAHLGALKSKGHRVINAMLGDKTYWKGIAITAGISAAAVGASFAAPLLLPAGVLASIGTSAAIGTIGGGVISTGPVSAGAAAAAGSAAITAAGLTITQVGATVATNVLQVTNAYRAVRGNAQINKSYAALGQSVAQSQRAGNARVQKILNKAGGINKSQLRPAVKHSSLTDMGVTFSEMQHALEAVAAGSGGTVAAKKDAPKGDGKSGGRKFDESKVKRDGDGMFARAASARIPQGDIRDPKVIDSEWRKGLDESPEFNKALANSGILKKINSKLAEIKKRTGVDLESAGKITPKILPQATEFATYMASEVNKVLTTTSVAVSPSGTQRARLIITKPGTVEQKWAYTLVDNNVKHDDLETEALSHDDTAKLAVDGNVLDQLMALLKQLNSLTP